jgi:hypothetical protein
MKVFRFERLENRLLLSSVAAASAAAPSTQLTAAATASATPVATALTHADRHALISRFSGTLAASLRKTLKHSGDSAFDISLLDYMVHRAGPVYFYNGKQLPRYADFIRQVTPTSIPPELLKADDILNHIFPEQINSITYTVQLGSKIDWDAPPPASETDNPDFLHTLNRQTFWRDLGIAYTLTGDGKYVRELVSQLQSWSAQTPALKNPNDWANSSPHWWLLDAADRASNWTDAYFMVLGSLDWTPAANTLFLKKIWEHGDFLDRADPSSYKTNKTAIQAGGLLRIGMMFPEFTAAAEWENHGVDMTFRCLEAQFYPDGGHIEETPAYAASAADAFLENYQLAALNGRTYWTKNRRRAFTNIIEALFQMLSPGGDIPGLSDTYRSSNPKPFITQAGYILNDSRYLISLATIDDVFLLGNRRLSGQQAHFADIPSNRGPSYQLPDDGYYILRGADVADGNVGETVQFSQVIIDAGPKGGTHGHYDLLDFEYSNTLDRPVIPDPGPLRYDNSDDRAYVISTPAHNTISIDGLNHEAVEGAHNPEIVVDDFEATATEARFTAHHHAYEYLAGKPTVGRTIWVDRTNPAWDIMLAVDWGRSDVTHTFTTSFNLFGTGADVVETSPGIVDAVIAKTQRMRVQSLPMPGQQLSLNDTFVSSQPPPDDKESATHLDISQTGTQAMFVTLFSQYVVTKSGTMPYPPASVAFETPPRAGQPVHLRLTYPDGTTKSLVFAPPDLSPLTS